ncbi:MAG: hypothetical protein EZS28_051066 [Streblomastix strix]|uniref:Uncharacterized protein n=1 Tax=Streblomastix strix TaxID=222440 RepID=A0A5J4T5B5_9EUKA|nr:MAG: hypothetical protein EZS28_051066 [Streblomastix strix]
MNSGQNQYTAPQSQPSQLTSISGIQEFIAPTVIQTNTQQISAFIACVKDIDLSSPFSHTCPKCHKFVGSSNRQGKRDQD